MAWNRMNPIAGSRNAKGIRFGFRFCRVRRFRSTVQSYGICEMAKKIEPIAWLVLAVTGGTGLIGYLGWKLLHGGGVVFCNAIATGCGSILANVLALLVVLVAYAGYRLWTYLQRWRP